MLHRAAYDALELDWTYDAYDVGEPALAGFVGGLGVEWRGLSLTSPLKRAAVGLCDEVDADGGLTGSVNTLLLQPGGVRSGFNTDVAGAVAALTAVGCTAVTRAVVVGAGATAGSVLLALSRLGCGYADLLARTAAGADRLAAFAESWGMRVEPRAYPLSAGDEVARADVLVSTIPAAAQAPTPDLPGRLATLAPVVFEVVYDPAQTPLLLAAQAAGAATVAGLDLLVHQAARQVELMTGVAPAPVDAMRAALPG